MLEELWGFKTQPYDRWVLCKCVILTQPNREMYIMDWTNTNGDTSNDQHPHEETPGKNFTQLDPVPVAKAHSRTGTTGKIPEGGENWPNGIPKSGYHLPELDQPCLGMIGWLGSWQLG